MIMILANKNLLNILDCSAERSAEQRVNIFNRLHPEQKLLRLDSVHRLNSSGGDDTLVDAICKGEYKSRKIRVDADEVFVNNGTKDALCGIGDILCRDVRIAIADPLYQTYVESNVLADRAGERGEDGGWSHLIYLDSDVENNFSPNLPEARPDVVYLCSPNNPTGSVLSKDELERWVKYATKSEVLILFDATYAPFIRDKSLPRSIYEIRGARKVAIEFRSFSRSAGFSGMHCGYMVIPKDLEGYSFSSDVKASLNELWRRREQIKSYPPSDVVQRAAEALYTPEGAAALQKNIDYYMKNASLLCEGLQSTGLRFWGGENSPYIWIESPYESSWKLFDRLLEECNIVVSLGERFGPSGAGFVRLSAFADQNEVIRASTRLSDFRV